MTNRTRTDHQLRMTAFDEMQSMKCKSVSRKSIIFQIHKKYSIPVGTLYDWYRGSAAPYGRRGKVSSGPELLYVLGALLGDGCLYNWKLTSYFVILVGDEPFARKYADKLTKVISRKSTAYIDRSKNIWFVRTNNFHLYSLFQTAREDLQIVADMITKPEDALAFIEGFFDAEGCVKAVKEKGRKTAKICLDVANTNFEYLEIVRSLLLEYLNIEARFSVQRAPRGSNRKTCYHLRIYRKDFVKTFLSSISTTKLRDDRRSLVRAWFAC